MKLLKLVGLLAVLLLSFGCGLVVCLGQNRWIDFTVLENYNPGKPSILLDDEGQEWGRFELDRRRVVSLKEIPQHLIDAFLAAEDRDFFKHRGISWRGIARSTLVNLRQGRIVQGASTITQQLVKLLFFDSQRTFQRKIKEQIVALLVERQFTKEQILETYLNHVYFGCGIYGVEAAARRFFGKAVCQLDLAESATLASVVKSPGQYCPLLCPLSAERRRNLVLQLVAKQKIIDQSICTDLINTPLQVCPADDDQLAPHLKENIRQFLEQHFGRQQLYRGGLVIQTTLNRKTQQLAQTAFDKQFAKLRKELGADVDGSLISMNAQTGEMKAVVGGVDFKDSKYDRACHARRQMGSIFKPIVYAAALQAGANFAQVEVDEPFELKFGGQVWAPRNSTRTFEGQMTLAKALSFSNNIVTVKTLLRAGCENVAHLAERFNLPGPIKPYPSIALGCIDVTLQEAVGAFNVFANNGIYVTPHYLKWVKNEWGIKIWRNQSVDQWRVLPSVISDQVTKVLGIGAQRFLSRIGGHQLQAEAIGKTGTTDDSRTCWFAGSTPGLTTALYLGRDSNLPLGNGIFPVWTLFPVWLRLHEKIAKAGQEFRYDPALHPININWVTGRATLQKGENTVQILV